MSDENLVEKLTEQQRAEQLESYLKSQFMLRAMLLPEVPTEQSLFDARWIIKRYAESGQQMPPKLLKHLSILLDRAPITGVKKQNSERIIALRVLHVLILQYWCGMSRPDACKAVYVRDGLIQHPDYHTDGDEDPKSLAGHCGRKEFAVSDAEFGELLDEVFSTYGTRDPEELKVILLAA